LSTAVTEQFQGDVTVASLGGTGHITMKQTFGPDATGTPWSLIAVRVVSSGTITQIYEEQTGGNTLLNHYNIGTTFRLNTIYSPNGGGAGAATVDVYINGNHVEQWTGGTPINYNKIGAYINLSGNGAATFTWQNVQFWTGGSINGGTPVAVDTPSFSPVAGRYAAQPVTLSSTTSGASIAYTTDGTTPTESGGTVTHGILLTNGGTVSVGASTTLNAIAFASGQTDSPVSTAAYTILSGQAAMPTFSPAAGTFSGPQTVSISTLTPGATILYTTDGGAPVESNGVPLSGTMTYSSPIAVTSTTTLNAIAFINGVDADSPMASGVFTLQAATPTFTPAAGTYAGAQSVTITSSTAGASIVYTTNGSTPAESGGVVANGTLLANGGAVNVSSSLTLRFLAFKVGYSDSPITNAIYTIVASQAAAPTFTPGAGTYTSAQSVTISSTTSGASIAYTTDGSTPTESGDAVFHGTALSNGGSVNLSTTATLKAMAFATGFADSTVTSAGYTISAPVPTTPRIEGSLGDRAPARHP
ncbi:MAG: chitobiase/beta-hexosaminidase C-terminal domain-containing protein, partial [Opitutaceae bacterium]